MKGDAVRHWHRFLEEESQGKNGLLCLYEPVRSEEVDHWCGVLAETLAGFLVEPGEDGN